MKKLIIILLGVSMNTFAQTKQHPLIPVSPTAASLGKYGDIDVSLYTGQINPSIKLLKIQFNDFTFPINLHYASSGLKVHEIPASVGMGWSIAGTSAITRQVRGVPDEQTQGYNGLKPTASIVQSINAGTYTPTSFYNDTEDNFKKAIGETKFDGEPDMFNFSFSGGGGKFFFDETQTDSPNKLAITIPKQPLRIIGNFNYGASGQLFNLQNQSGRIESFEITDEKGIKYTFAKQEGAILVDDEYQFGKNIVSTWYLSKIETPNGNTLDFNYIQRTIDQPHAQSEYRYLYETLLPFLDYGPKLTVSRTTTTETVLQEILINNGERGKVEFVEELDNREDWAFSLSGTKPKALKEVRLKDGQNNLVRKFLFSYVAGAKRLLLRSVQEFGPTNSGTPPEANEPYIFEYYKESDIPSLPSEGSNVISREDHWGYYNANNKGTLLPDYSVVTSAMAEGSKQIINRNFSSFQFDNYLDSLKKVSLPLSEKPNKAASTFAAYFVTATNRNPDFSSALIGQLKRIDYPTKGFSEFVYEANSYFGRNDEFNPCSGNYQTIGSVTKTFSIAETCPSPITATFTVAEGAYSCMKVNWTINLGSVEQDIIDGEVFIINNESGLIYSQHNLSCRNNENALDQGSNYVVLPPGNYTINAKLCREVTGSNSSLAFIDVQAIPTVVGSAFVTRTSGGVRIKEMKDCPDADPTHCLIKEYIYTPEDDPSNSSGRIVTNGKYAYPVQYFTTHNGGNFVNAYYLNSASQLPLSTTLGQYIGYNTVLVKEAKIVGGSREYKGKTVYDYRSPDENEAPDLTGESFPYWSVSYDWKRGVVEQMKIYDQSGDLLKHDQNDYVLKPSLNYSKYTSIKAGKFIHNVEASPNGYNPNIFSFRKYQSVSGFQYNQESTTQERYKNNGNLSRTIKNSTQYVYGNDSHLQLTQTGTSNSKREVILTEYKYPNDITTGDLLPSASLLATRKAELLQTESFLNGSSVSKVQNFFGVFGGKTLPSNQKTFLGGSSTPATETQQLSYDTYGNLTSFKEAGGPTHCFLWGYNGQYPVIYIANGTPPDARALLATFDVSTIESTANSLRGSLPNAHISSYTFKPMVGMLSSTAPNLLKTSFSFDALNRLDRVFDHDNNIVKAYQYQYASSLGGNSFVKELIPRIGSNNLVSGYQNIQTTLAYVDGLGRNLQTVSQEAGPNGANDIITNAVTYDGYGRNEKSYIPFSNVGNGALANLPSSVHGDSRPFTENFEFDNSPLNRLSKVRGVGNAWQSADKFSENNIEITGGIRSYSVASDGSVSSGTYPANSLYKKTNKDEQGNSSIEYTDKQGRLVQKEQQLNATDYAITAYIYNDNGQLAFIVQPEAYNTATNFDKNSTIFTLGIFAYEYDDRGRQIAKHVPSGGWTYSVYDKLNREVLSQTELQRPDNKWRFIKFDAFNRTIQKGDLTNASSRNDLQNLFNAITNAYEEGSSNQSFPSSVSSSPTQQREAFIYDDYGFIAGEWAFNRANTYHDNYANAKGLLTGAVSWNSGDFSKVYHTVYHYDSKGRVIQTYQTHQLGGSQPWTKANIGNFYYNFNGQVLIDKKIQQKDNAPTIEDKTENEYDHVGRLTKVFHGINGNRFEVVRLTYDQVGRLKQKKFRADENFLIGGALDYINRPPSPSPNIDDIARKAIFLNVGTVIDANSINKYSATINPDAPQGVSISGLQTMDFSHHIRGGLRGINLDGSGNPTPNATEGDLFSYKLDYETTGFYDGNIGKQSWQGVNDQNQAIGLRSYTYGYDKSSRLLSGIYAGINGENFSLYNISYDKNGNILNLQRKGNNGGSFGDIDNLTYNYSGNKLNYVNDAINGNEEIGDFRNNNTGTNDYEYWNDGSLKVDRNKGILLIEYDSYLKKTKKISFSTGWVEFFYNGDGTLIKRTNSLGDVWDYCLNGMIYKNGQPYQLPIPEGRAVYVAGQWVYEFEYLDHLGNLRISFRANGNQLTITQSNTPDPFGLDIKPLSNIGNTPNNFQFNKIEKVNDFGINIHHAFFRDGDSQIGRWWQIDSKPNPSMSLYAMMGNNPMRYTDPLGDTTIVNNRGTILKQYGKDNSVFLQGKKGKLEAIGEIGKSINISKILPNILRENRVDATKMGSLGFANAVRPGGKWDYKNIDAQKGNIFGVTAQYEKETDKNTSFISGKLNFVEGGSDVGNFNFGYTGRYADGGYSPLTLWAFGGVLQIGKDLIKGKFGKAFGELDSVTPIIRPSFGDEQDDFIWTTTGIIHANNEKKNN